MLQIVHAGKNVLVGTVMDFMEKFQFFFNFMDLMMKSDAHVVCTTS